MLTSEARVRTDRASRYLTQLSDHGSKMRLAAFHHRRDHQAHAAGDGPASVQRAQSDGTEGVIDFGWGRCTLVATADELVLTIQAEDQSGLRRIEEGIAARLQRIGRRDRLTVIWRQTEAETRPEGATDERG